MSAIKKHLLVYKHFFVAYLKSRLIYKTDFVLGFVAQLINLAFSIAFLTLIFTQVDTIQGWTFNELLLLVGFGGIVLNLHHFFFFALFRLGKDYIITGRMDRFLVRPLNPLFQVFGNYVAEDNFSKLIANIALLIYAWGQIGLPVTLSVILYGLIAALSGVMIIGGIFLLIATTSFWTGRSMELFWIFFNISDFRKYPFGIYALPVQAFLVTLMPLAFASFFPATFFLGRDEWVFWQYLSLVAGPVFYLLAYQFWKYGVSNYSSTGS